MKYTTFILCALILFSGFTTVVRAQPPKDYDTYITYASESFHHKRYRDCHVFFEKAFKLQDPPAQHHFNIACCYSLDGNLAAAFKNLNKAIDKGYMDLNYLQTTPHLEDCRNDPQWSQLLSKVKQKIAQHEAGLNKELRQELFKMKREDVAFKKWVDSLYFQMNDYIIDSLYGDKIEVQIIKLTNDFKQLTDKYGWPKLSEVGDDGSEAAFYLVQRLGTAEQKRYLLLIAQAARDKEAKMYYAAILQDMTLKADGKPQRYGTQIIINDMAQYELYPVADFESLNERRKQVGLSTIEEYLKRLGIKYHPEKGE